MNMIIDYLGHSGFLVETADALMLFDYERGDLGVLERKPAGKPLYVFVSHIHGDHFNPMIFTLKGRTIRYILSFDLKGDDRVPQDRDVRFVDADKIYDIAGLGTVETLLSTDEGVAFLVRTKDTVLFHAGDLHWWDWPGEDPAWLQEQETVFRREISRLSGVPIDAAFVVLDDRLEENYAGGMMLFLELCRAKYVLPMHFWNDRSVIARFRELAGTAAGTVLLDTANENHWEL
ncbi:MAG: MBL fold metallo-hydrolase [Solobacterium sp.]|nr:MBL fold metallo-hydrolase [Solobacterium sp.]